MALHRVSWLLFNHRDLSPSDVLVVGPTRAFVRYIRTVLPTLGDADVQQRDIGSLAPSVATGRQESDEVALLKGDHRMTSLIDRGLTDRIGLPEDQLTIVVGQTAISIDHVAVEAQLQRLIDRPYAIGRGLLRDWLREHVVQATRGTPARADTLDAVLDRIWPQLTAPAFVQELLGSESRLLRAGGEDFSAAEIGLLYRRASTRISDEVWSDPDLPLLDYAQYSMTGEVEATFAHVVVDEAQDLSPMQLLSIRRRSTNGSMTILGDIAQSTGAWARDDWDEVIAHLQQELPATQRELAYGYRVPRQIFELANRLLPKAAPGVKAPTIIRDGPENPRLDHVGDPDDIAIAVVGHVRDYLAHGLMVAVICPDDVRAEVTGSLDRANVHWRNVSADGIGAGVNVLTPTESKGLEFDAVVIVRPDLVVQSDLHGERLLYIAMTRSTTFMSVIHTSGAIPDDGGERATSAGGAATTTVPTQPLREARTDIEPDHARPHKPTRIVATLANSIAEDIKSALNPELWEQLLREIAEELRETE